VAPDVLSTFMFGSDYTIEQPPGTDTTVLHMPVTFAARCRPARIRTRSGTAPRVDAYNYSTTVHFIIRAGWWSARCGPRTRTPRVPSGHTWDGLWHWEQQGVQMPYVSIYDYLLSKGNPYADQLDSSYRALEARMRQNNCQACTRPTTRATRRSSSSSSIPTRRWPAATTSSRS